VTAAVALAAACLAGGLLVDPGAEAAFDAPKRLVALVAIAVALPAALVAAPRPPRAASAAARLARGLLACGLAGAAVAALASPHPAAALEAGRLLAFGAVLLPLGASGAVAGRGGALVLAAAIAAALVNAGVSLLQAAGVFQPFALEAVAGRTATGAFIGNEGQLALTLALASVAALALVAARAAPWHRRAGAAALAVLGAALVVNATLTALAALLAGLFTLLVVRGTRGGAVVAVAAVFVAVAAAAAAPPLRARVADILGDARRGAWDDVTSNRLGPWAAAVEMVRVRPLAGWGPGSFPVEFVPYRLRAELRHRTRLVIPRLTASYGEAHNEYLQAAAELGMPTAAALVGAATVLLVGLARRARAPAPAEAREATLLLALLVAGAVAALTWFPLQRPATAVPLLLASGRAWRLLG
jgi:O-antigen ligase